MARLVVVVMVANHPQWLFQVRGGLLTTMRFQCHFGKAQTKIFAVTLNLPSSFCLTLEN